MNRRSFLIKTPLSAALAPVASRLLSADWRQAAESKGRKITFLHDGGFDGDAWKWQFTEGAFVDKTVSRMGQGASLRVSSQAGAYARQLVLNPTGGSNYTISGWLKTSNVQPLREGGGAFYAAPQFEFQGRPSQYTAEGHIEEQHLGNFSGTQDWTRFQQTFTCLEGTTWFEVAIGLYRASGTVWFEDLTFVEGKEAVESDSSIEVDQAAEFAHRVTLASRKAKRPQAAILRDHFPVRGKATDPHRLSELLENEYEVRFVDAEGLSRITRSRVDLLVLPYGESFPAAAQGALHAYLANGGCLLTTGGYAFQSPLVKAGKGWQFDDVDARQERGSDLLPALTTTASWTASSPEFCRLDTNPPMATVRIPNQVWGQSADWHSEVAAQGLAKRYRLQAELKWSGVNGSQGGYAFISLEQIAAKGEIVYATPAEFDHLRGDSDWKLFEETIALSPETKRLRVRFGLHSAGGLLQARDVRLHELSGEPRINTAKGFPQDELVVKTKQIGMFDPDYRLKRVHSLRSATDQVVIGQAVNLQGHFSGFAASGVLGIDHSRWTPLLNAYDRYGRLRGSAGSLMHNYGGEYARSSWAFFGIDNVDLFATPEGAAIVQSVAKTLARNCFLRELETDLASYRPGETVQMRTRVSNYGLQPRQLRVQLSVVPSERTEAVFRKEAKLALEPGETLVIPLHWETPRFDHVLYQVNVTLLEGAEQIDYLKTGFTAWSDSAVEDRTHLTAADNYLQLNKRPTFIQGTDDYIYMFLNRDENPLTWNTVASGCRDTCVDIYENLLGLRGPQQNPPKAWWRWIDAMALLVQQAGGVFMPGMLIFSNTAVSSADLEEQKRFCRSFAERYRQVSGLIYYLNGDLELHDPNVLELQKMYHAFLIERYGTESQVRAAWTLSPPEATLEKLPIRSGKDDWRDLRTEDDYHFRTQLVRRWLGELAAEIRSVDSAHPITAEFYQSSDSGIDLVTASDDLDFSNFGYFGNKDLDWRRFPAVLKFLDQSLKGKGAHVGEFGVKTHPAWLKATDYLEARTENYEQDYFLTLTHTAFGQGAAKVQNWSWKYPSDLPFEWGIHYPCDGVPRDVQAYYRNSGLLFRHYRPLYRPPKAVVLLPDSARKGGQGQAIYEGLLNSLRLLLDARVSFGTLEDGAIDRLPPEVDAIFYPLSYCPRDATYDRLVKFVKDGGRLYISGDISYDRLRRRTKINRLKELCGVRFGRELFPNVAFGHFLQQAKQTHDAEWPSYRAAPGILVIPEEGQVLAQTEDNVPTVIKNSLGSGMVIFSPDPFELHAPDGNKDGPAFYRSLLQHMNIAREKVAPDDGDLHVYRIPTHSGETVCIGTNYGKAALNDVTLFIGSKTVSLSVPMQRPCLATIDVSGKLTAAEFIGELRIQAEVCLRSECHLIAMAEDRASITESKRLLLMPMGTGTIRIPHARRWTHASIIAGAVSNGRWTTYENIEPQLSDDWLQIEVDEDRNLSLILVCESGDETSLGELIAERTMRPWTLDGRKA